MLIYVQCNLNRPTQTNKNEVKLMIFIRGVKRKAKYEWMNDAFI